ncbi:MAG: tRNA threonylcarbamoyladenosine dehydratase [Bacteroidales bacterium]|nr:tRNA threonylcarbamoyladenosine dehydratase [Bacteroidales bacterium]
MLPDWLSRTALLLDKNQINQLHKAHVLVVGLGGVGAYAVEMLCRAGIYNLTLVDGDRIETSNRNRQLPALLSQEGRYKTEVLKERCLDINPEANIQIITEFLKDNRIEEVFDLATYDYVVDAIDSLSPKVHLIIESIKRNIPIISAMGAGGKLHPSYIQVADISKTYQCPLAAAVRKRLRKKGVFKGIKTVFSTEPPNNKEIETSYKNIENHQNTQGTISFLPAIFGCWCASVCINDLIKD